MPKVSVIVPNYNHAPYLSWRLDSILNQTYQDYDLIILDDASTDNSREVLGRYLDRPGVSLHYNQINSGSVFRQWEKGFDLAQGEYVWVAESDDWADPRFLQRLVSVLETNAEVGVAYAQSWIVDPSFKVTGNALCWTEDLDPARWERDFFSEGRAEISRYLTVKNTIPNASAVLMRRSVLEKVRPIDAGFRLCGDWLHWIRMLAISDLAFVAEPLNFWRLDSSNARVAAPGTMEWIEGERVLSQAAGLLGLSESERDKVLLNFLRKCWAWQREHIEITGIKREKRIG